MRARFPRTTPLKESDIAVGAKMRYEAKVALVRGSEQPIIAKAARTCTSEAMPDIPPTPTTTVVASVEALPPRLLGVAWIVPTLMSASRSRPVPVAIVEVFSKARRLVNRSSPSGESTEYVGRAPRVIKEWEPLRVDPITEMATAGAAEKNPWEFPDNDVPMPIDAAVRGVMAMTGTLAEPLSASSSSRPPLESGTLVVTLEVDPDWMATSSRGRRANRGSSSMAS